MTSMPKPGKVISIHALLAESDREPTALRTPHHNFYPRSPCGERLDERCKLSRNNGNFYPRSPCGERLDERCKLSRNNGISIHALLAESDTWQNLINGIRLVFLSTLSLRRATAKVHKTVGHFCAYETNFMGIASSC